MTHDEIEEYLRFLHGSLDAGEEIYLAPADNPEGCFALDSLENAVALAREWQDRGCFISTGTFVAGKARSREHLLSVPVLMLDADLKLVLVAEGVDEDTAAAKIYSCSPAVLAKLCAKHRQLIIDTLERVGLTPSALVFSGGGHQVSVCIDFLDQRNIGRIVAVYKNLVTTLNESVGWEMFEKEVSDAGTRYLRCAGTFNTKSTPPRLATIVQNGGPTFTLDQLEAIIGRQSAQEEHPPDSEEAKDSAEDSSTTVVNILLPYWKKGTRHDLALSLSGYLAKAEWPWRKAKACLLAIASQAGDEQLRSRLADLKGTYARFAQGKEVKGYTALAEILTAADLKRLEDAVGAREIPIEEEEEQSQPDELVVTPYSDIIERETSWLHYPYLPARAVVSMEGNPGEGKSWVSLALAASVSLGKFPFTFSDGRPMAEQEGRDLSEPANVLHINVEDDPEETIKKRLRILGADCSRVFLIQGVRRYLKNGDKVLRFTVDQIPALEQSIMKHSARLVILDPIQAYLPKGADMNKAESVRPLMDGLMQMARRTGCTVLIVRHFGKRMTETSLYKAIGSIDFAACVRSVLIVGLYPKEKDSLSLYERGAVTHAKSNVGSKGLSLDFELRQDQFAWIGTSTATANDFTGPKADEKKEEEEGALQDAKKFLQELLAFGPTERSVVLEEGKKIGMTERTLERAARRLGVKKERTYKDGKVVGSIWKLPVKE